MTRDFAGKFLVVMRRAEPTFSFATLKAEIRCEYIHRGAGQKQGEPAQMLGRSDIYGHTDGWIWIGLYHPEPTVGAIL